MGFRFEFSRNLFTKDSERAVRTMIKRTDSPGLSLRGFESSGFFVQDSGFLLFEFTEDFILIIVIIMDDIQLFFG